MELTSQRGCQIRPPDSLLLGASTRCHRRSRRRVHLPTAAQRQEQIDLIERDLSFCRRQLRVRGGQRARSIQIGNKRFPSGDVKPMRLISRFSRRFLRGPQRIGACVIGGIGGETGLRLPQRLQHDAIELSERSIGAVLRFANPPARAVHRKGPTDQRTEAPSCGRLRAEILENPGQASGSTDTYCRIQRPSRHADPRRRCSQLALSFAHIGTPAQQCGAIATKAIDEVWRLGFVNCECGLEVAILDSTFQALHMQAAEIQAKLRRLMSSH